MSSITPKPGMTVEISMQGIEKSRLDAIEAAESLRKANEAERTEAELMRKEGEAGRITAEQERTMEEDARNLAESGRILAEENRVTAENLRSIGEQSRVESEELRENAEAARVTAETARANAEALRQQTFEANESNRQTAYESAESARESEWTEIKSNVESSVGSAVASASAATDAANTAADNANAAAEKSVRYDVAQKISDAQKAQARENIEAASEAYVSELKGDVAAITPDDNAVDGKPWTSEKIVEALCPPFETTGSIVQCNPVEHYPLGVVSRIDATQSGTGDASPDNIRPIVGWDAMQIVNSNDAGETNTYTAELPETIYGGELDWNTGVLTVDRRITIADGTVNKFTPDRNGDFWNMPFKSAPGTIDVMGVQNSHFEKNKFGLNGYGEFLFTMPGYMNGLFDTADNLNAYLVEQNASGTPVTFVYKLKTPYTVQLTPQQITSLSGTNTLYTDSGDTAVSGRADPVWLTQSLMERIAALESAATNI